jgi:NAD(P)-dependent dehydrogenase (short-subunit alcohol dehydrogenase family)
MKVTQMEMPKGRLVGHLSEYLQFKSNSQHVALLTGIRAHMAQWALSGVIDVYDEILIVDRDEKFLNEAGLQFLEQGGGYLQDCVFDFVDPDLSNIMGDVLNGRKITEAIHCAATATSGNAPEVIFEQNLLGSMRVIDAVLPHMAEGGHLLLVTPDRGCPISPALDQVLSEVSEPEQIAALAALAPDSAAAYTMSMRGVQHLAHRKAAAFKERGSTIEAIRPSPLGIPVGGSLWSITPSGEIVERPVGIDT